MLNKRQKVTPNLTPRHPPTPPVTSAPTIKQLEVLKLLDKRLNTCQMARKLNINEASVRDRLKFCIKKGLVSHPFGSYNLTKEGRLALNNSGSGVEVSAQKNVHNSQFTIKILGFPIQWSEKHFFMQKITPNYNHVVNSKMWFLYLKDCTIRIAYGKTKKITFMIKEQPNESFEEASNQAWNLFTQYFELMKGKGFSLDYLIDSPNPHFADPNGFFAKLASMTTNKGFRIETDAGAFWIDFSPHHLIPEEESDNEIDAKRTENLARSALTSQSDFNDLDKAIATIPDIIKLQHTQAKLIISMLPKPEDKPKKQELPTKKSKGDYFG